MEFLLLANSRKAMPKEINRPGRCVAGVNLDTGEFVRLVSNDDGAALDWNIFQNATPGTVFSIVVDHKAPEIGAQSENWVLGSGLLKYLRKEQGTDWIKPYVDKKKEPFGDPYTYYFESTYAKHRTSLCVIMAYAIRIYAKSGEAGRRKIDFNVYSRGRDPLRIEDMSMTDPVYHNCPVSVFDRMTGLTTVIDNENVDVHFGKAYLVISLPSTPMEDGGKYFNKFVAAVIPCE